MGFCELTRVLCCTGSVASAAGCGKGGGLGETAALLAAVPLLIMVQGGSCSAERRDVTLGGQEDKQCGQLLQATASSRQRHRLGRDGERNSRLGSKR